MAEDATLLAYLVPRLSSRVEDTATDALAFILNKSAACRGALDGLLRGMDFNPEPIVRVETQVTYQDGSRPDMVGYGRSGAKRLLVESKFWASLQESQASGYFRQLEEIGPGVLLFIAPHSRTETLWAEIRRQMENGAPGVELDVTESTERTRKAKIVGSDKRLMLVSWDHLLGGLAIAAADNARLASDIQQLLGLATHQDEEAFQPIHPEEFGLALPRRIRGLNRLIDDVRKKGGADGWISTDGLAAAPQRQGYGRYLRFRKAAHGEIISGDLFLCVHYRLWADNGHSPLWLWLSNEVPINAARMADELPLVVQREKSGARYVPIHLKTGVEYEHVLDDIVRQLKAIRDMIDWP